MGLIIVKRPIFFGGALTHILSKKKKESENIMTTKYDCINHIKENLLEYDNRKLTSVVTNAFNRMYKDKEPDGCLSISTQIVACLQYLGYDAKLIIGQVYNETNDSFYHAWVELDNKIIDVSGYGNSNWSPLYFGKPWLYPVINELYEESKASEVDYHKFEFDEDWLESQISVAEGWSITKYFDGSPRKCLWQLSCDLLGMSLIIKNKQRLKDITDTIIIGK